MDPTLLNLIIGMVSFFGPALLARLGIHLPNITPVPGPLQVPTLDKPLADCLTLLDQYAAKTYVPDEADNTAMRAIEAKITALLASQPAKPA